jgi:hypothetical protein
MRSIHPFTYIILGFLCLSLGFNLLQKSENHRLRKMLDKKSHPIIIDLPDPYPYPNHHKNNGIRKTFNHTT